jgi:hypothetical protein
MAHKHSIQRYRTWYAILLRLYSKPHYERFGEGMEQTFADLLMERTKGQSGLLGCALWMFTETTVGIVREHMALIMIQNRNMVRVALATAFILMVPLVAMQFTEEVNWDLADFVIGGLLLFGTGFAFERVARKGGNFAYRMATGVALAAGLILVWINLAVGLIGNESNPANLMYFVVLLIGTIGAISARFRPRGMARALFAMALAQILVPVIALVIGRPGVSTGEVFLGMVGVFGVNSIFVLLFIVSAGLYRNAALDQATGDAEPEA